MPVTTANVEHVAALARLSFTEAEKQKLTLQLNTILAYMEQLNTLDTSRIEPLSHVIELKTAFREDTLQPSLSQEDALRNAPARTDKFYRVPKVIGER